MRFKKVYFFFNCLTLIYNIQSRFIKEKFLHSKRKHDQIEINPEKPSNTQNKILFFFPTIITTRLFHKKTNVNEIKESKR